MNVINFSKLKVGYWPIRLHLDHPGDRRRFIFFAKEKNIAFEVADAKKQYDVVYLTATCNVSQWIAYKRSNPYVKLIFEITDSYLLEPWNLSSILRSTSRYVTRNEKKWYVDYRQAFLEIVRIADAVVCSTPVQREHLLSYNSNVHISLDYFSEDITNHKLSFATQGKIKLVWEGQAYTIKNLLLLNDVFAKLKNKIELHIITDPVIKYPLKIFNRSTKLILKKLACSWHFHKWEKDSFSKIIADSDAAIIPIDNTNKLWVNKPENKLLLFWEIGIPVITSLTPAYKRVMDAAGLDSYCLNHNESWLKAIQVFIDTTSKNKQKQMEKAHDYLEKFHSKQRLIADWEELFTSILPIY